jgi:hypothetical protein
MRAIPIVVGATAVLAALAAWSRQQVSVEPPALASRAAELPSIEGEAQAVAQLAALQARIARLEQQVGALETRNAAGSAASSSASGLAQHLVPQSASIEGDDAPALDLASTFDRHQSSAWQAPRAAELESRMRAVLPPDASLDRLECRGEICRVEVTVTGIARYREFLKSAFANPSTRVWNGATKVGYVTEPDPRNWEHDEISVFAYLGPQGGQGEP